MIKEHPHFIVVDDDSFNNMLCQLVITNRRTNVWGATYESFTMPEEALQHIKKNYAHPEAKLSVLLLDINMPEINGWEFLEYFNEFDKQIKESFRIYILSSSVYDEDVERARANANVVDFISKPITLEKVKEIIDNNYQL